MGGIGEKRWVDGDELMEMETEVMGWEWRAGLAG